MLRKLLLYLSQLSWAQRFVSSFFLARRVAERFVAGETLDDAINTTQALNRQGLTVSLDYLGESVTAAADTQQVVATYTALIHRIAEQGLSASVSLKLTHLGLDIDEALCLDNLCAILKAAGPHDLRVTIDMESSDYTDTTLRIYRTMRDEHGFSNLGTVVQSALRRTRDDMRQLAGEGARIRLCKGAYLEPATVAYPEKAEVDASYRAILSDFFMHTPPALMEIATHDEKMIAHALDLVQGMDVPATHYEFQMLYGIRTARQHELAAAGHPVRVYVPFGEAWYPYFMRRLAERPANLWFFLRSLVRS